MATVVGQSAQDNPLKSPRGEPLRKYDSISSSVVKNSRCSCCDKERLEGANLKQNFGSHSSFMPSVSTLNLFTLLLFFWSDINCMAHCLSCRTIHSYAARTCHQDSSDRYLRKCVQCSGGPSILCQHGNDDVKLPWTVWIQPWAQNVWRLHWGLARVPLPSLWGNPHFLFTSMLWLYFRFHCWLFLISLQRTRVQIMKEERRRQFRDGKIKTRYEECPPHI